MSNSAWTDLKSKGNILMLHDKCPHPKCGCQKIITFTPHQYMLGGGSNKNKLQKISRGTKEAWDSFIKPGLYYSTDISCCGCKNKKILNQLKVRIVF